MGALPDQFELELGQRPEDVEDQLAAGRDGIDLLGQGLEARRVRRRHPPRR